MAELAALFTVYRGSAADSGFYRKKNPSGWRQGRAAGWGPPDAPLGRNRGEESTDGGDRGKPLGRARGVLAGGRRLVQMWQKQGGVCRAWDGFWGWLEPGAVKLLHGKAGMQGASRTSFSTLRLP